MFEYIMKIFSCFLGEVSTSSSSSPYSHQNINYIDSFHVADPVPRRLNANRSIIYNNQRFYTYANPSTKITTPPFIVKIKYCLRCKVTPIRYEDNND